VNAKVVINVKTQQNTTVEYGVFLNVKNVKNGVVLQYGFVDTVNEYSLFILKN